MILKNLWRRKIRTGLTVLGIAVGVAAVVSLSAFGEGLANGFGQAFSSAEADLMVGQKDALMLYLSAVDETVGQAIEQMPGVAAVAGTVVGVEQMPAAPYFMVLGEDPREFRMAHYRLIAGQPLSGRKQILLGKLAAENFKKQPGDAFRLVGMTYRVVGIYETGENLEDGGAVMLLADAQRAFDKREQVSYYAVQVTEARQINELKQTIESRWPALAATRSGEASQQTEMLDLVRSFGWFVGIFAVLVGGLGMLNTTLMSVYERTREMGVLRAVGWSRWRVMGLIWGEALMLALVGAGVGLGLGVGLTELARLSPAVASMLRGEYTPAMFIQALVLALLLGSVGGLYPAWRAAQLAPAEAMRYESGAGLRVNPLARFLGGSALRNLWRRPTRTLITLTGLGLGVGFIVALVAVAEGFLYAFDQMTAAGQVDLVAEEVNCSDISLSAIDERTAMRIRARPEVKSISRMILGVTSAPGLPFLMLYGLDPAEDYIRHYRIREGQLMRRGQEIILGRFAANSLKKGVGDKVRLGGTSYTIVGIYENGSAYEDAGGVMLLRDAQNFFNRPDQMTLLGIQLKPEYQPRAAEIARQLETRFPEVIVSRSEELTSRLQDMQTTYAFINALIALTLVVGGIVMMNAMLMSVFERTQEIGVLRALGWTTGRVMGMVVVEALALSLLSGLVGIGMGWGLNAVLLLEPTLGMYLQPAYSPALFVEVGLLAGGLGLVGGLYPAWRAARLRPIEALRYE